jgi:hypothetical protein
MVMITAAAKSAKAARNFRPVSGQRYDALLKLIVRYRNEAEKAAKVRAYYAACILIGSALEGSLLAMCTARAEDVEDCLAGLPRNQRPPKAAQDWTLNQLLAVAAALQWLPARPNKYSRTRLADWAHLIRELRNLVHPGKHIREYPRVRLGCHHWRDAKAVFDLANDSLLDLVQVDLRMQMRRHGIVPRP